MCFREMAALSPNKEKDMVNGIHVEAGRTHEDGCLCSQVAPITENVRARGDAAVKE